MLQTPTCFPWDLQQCCKHQPVFRGTCNNVANTNPFSVGLATMLQTPTRFPWDLQQCCKHQPVFRGTCGNPANAKAFPVRLAGLPQTPTAFPVGLAGLPQTPTRFPWDLRESRKRQPHLRGTCGNPANTNPFSVGLAGTPANPKSIPELPKLTADDQLLPLGRLYAAHDAGVDVERATEGDDFFCSRGV